MKTSSPERGKRGEKFIAAIERSKSLPVMLLILPGVLCSISLEAPQLKIEFEGSSVSFLSTE